MFLSFLAEGVRRFGWSVSAWVLMSNHYHLIVQTPAPNLSKGMHWLNGRYAQWFNKRHKRSGHLFQGRFKGLLIERERYFAEVLRYVVLNPVRAKMVARPEDYQWSSYRATAGLESAPDWLDVGAALDRWGSDPAIAQTCYRQFVLDKVGVEDPLWQQLVHGIYLGSDEWAKAMRKIVESKPRSTDHPAEQLSIGRPAIQEIITVVADVAGESPENIRQRGGSPLRALTAWLGWYEGWITLREMAAALRLRSESRVSKLVRIADRLLGTDPALRTHLDSALERLRPK